MKKEQLGDKQTDKNKPEQQAQEKVFLATIFVPTNQPTGWAPDYKCNINFTCQKLAWLAGSSFESVCS